MTTAIRSTSEIKTELESMQNRKAELDTKFRTLEAKLKKLAKKDLINKVKALTAWSIDTIEPKERAELIQIALRWEVGQEIEQLGKYIANTLNELVEAEKAEREGEVTVVIDGLSEEYEKSITKAVEDAKAESTAKVLSDDERNRRASTPRHLLDPKKRVTKRNEALILRAVAEWFGTESAPSFQSGPQTMQVVVDGEAYDIYSDYRWYYFLTPEAE